MANLTPRESLRVLLISAREEARDEVGGALAARAGDHRLYWVSQPDLALARLQDLIPHVILVDDTLGDANPASLVGQLASRMSGAAILMLIGAGDMALARQAVLAGARGFVIKPLQAEELMAAVRQVLAQHREGEAAAPTSAAEQGRIVVFCAPKGGTGRTTLALNTAVALREIAKAPVVLVDADYAAPALDVALNLDPSHNITDLLPRISRLDADIVSSVLAAHASGVRVLLAPPPADLTHPISLPQVQQVLVWLKRMFPWVIVDLGLPLDETAFAFLDGADRIVMSVLPEMVGLRNTRLMLDQLHARGYPEEKTWLVLNRAALPGGVLAGDIEDQLRVSIRYRIPDDQPLATHSINRGVPLMMSHRGSAVARAIRGFAMRLAEDSAAERGQGAQEASSGLLRRLFIRTRPTGA